MSNLTNQLYRANPDFREQLEAKARELRRREFKRLVVKPLLNIWNRAISGTRSESAHRVAELV